MKQITLQYYGVTGTGKTVKEAKQDAGRKIEKIVQGDYTLRVVRTKRHTAVIWNTPDGWVSRIITGPETQDINRVWPSAHHPEGVEEAMDRVSFHLCQLEWKPCDTEPALELPPAFKAEWDSWVVFQRRYAEARKKGMNDTEAHFYAVRNPSRPDLWADDKNAA